MPVPVTPFSRSAASHPRIDVVVDRNPDSYTDVAVYLDGVEIHGPHLVMHVIDPGAGGATHEWLTATAQHADDVPQAVRDKASEIADAYHDPYAATDNCCG